MVLIGATILIILTFYISNHRLRFEVTQRTAAEQAKEEALIEAQTANKAKSEFLATMSHELRTPLNAITGFSEMIRSEALGQIDNKRYLEYADHIHTSGKHLISIVNNILDLSKVEAGELEIELSEFPIEDAISDSVRLVSFSSARDRESIQVNIAENTAHLKADIKSFKQIIINLLANADKYSPLDGRIQVNVARPSEQQILIQICDEGIGIPEQDIKRVQEPFGQARSDAHVSHEGTGLGLSVSKSLMELHGGSLEIESTIDVGTTVSLTFNGQ
jgi:two-component system cell cycle sensor histidine kinase PleC